MTRLPAAVVAAVMLVAAAGLTAQSQWQDILRNLRHPDADTRRSAVERLGSAGYVPAIEPIVPLIADPDDRVQAAALDAELNFFLGDRISGSRGLGNSKSRSQQAFDAGPLIRPATAAPPALIDALIAAIRDENARVRFDAVHTLGFIAERPLPAQQVRALADELDHYDPVIRMATARVLGRLRQREAGDRLLMALDDSNSTVRQLAVEALGLVREDRAVTTFRDLIARARPNNNIDGLLLGLARIGAPDDLGLFRQHLMDKSAGSRRASAEGLGRLADRQSMDALSQIFKTDRSAEVRLAAAFALHLLGQPQSHVIASMLVVEETRAQARDYLFEIGRAAVPGIQATLEVATDARHRADLIQTVGYVGAAADLPVVEAFLKNPDERVVRAATYASYRLRRQ